MKLSVRNIYKSGGVTGVSEEMSLSAELLYLLRSPKAGIAFGSVDAMAATAWAMKHPGVSGKFKPGDLALVFRHSEIPFVSLGLYGGVSETTNHLEESIPLLYAVFPSLWQSNDNEGFGDRYFGAFTKTQEGWYSTCSLGFKHQLVGVPIPTEI
jgi:hypothetical protein